MQQFFYIYYGSFSEEAVAYGMSKTQYKSQDKALKRYKSQHKTVATCRQDAWRLAVFPIAGEGLGLDSEVTQFGAVVGV